MIIVMQILDIIKESKLGFKNGVYEGSPLNFKYDCTMDTMIENLTKYKKPCNVWGLKNHIKDDYYLILCVDVLTGDIFDIEIWDGAMRLYNRANPDTILRLYKNLQKITNISLI